MKFQKIISFFCIAAAALTFIYSLGVSTDVYFLKQVVAIKEDFAGVEMFYAMQPFNKTFTSVGLVLVLLAVAGLVANNHTRRRYYVANYCTIGLSSVAGVSAAIWGLINVFKYKEMFLAVDFTELQKLLDTAPESVFINNGLDPTNLQGPYSTFWFDLSIAVFGILILASLLNLANAVFKTVLMAEEKKLIEKGDM